MSFQVVPQFCTLVFLSSGILGTLPDEFCTLSLESEHFKNNFLKYSGANEFKDLYVNVAVSFLIGSLIVDQPRF